MGYHKALYRKGQHNVRKLLVTHTDRDGILSAALLLRALSRYGNAADVHILMTQGAYLADELEELVDAGHRFSRLCFTDTYFFPVDADRIAAAVARLRLPGADVEWFDHHPSSADNEPLLRELLCLSPRSLIIGDRGKPGFSGRRESVSIVRQAFGLKDAESIKLENVARGGRGIDIAALHREADVAPWLAVIDGLTYVPEFPPEDAVSIIRSLSTGFATPPPAQTQLLQDRALRATANVGRALMDGKFPSFPTVDGGKGVVADLRPWFPINAYTLQWELFAESHGLVDLFVSVESGWSLHYVTGSRARRKRNLREGLGKPTIRIATFHRGTSGRNTTRPRRALDLRGLIRRRPGAQYVRWIDAHPYLVKTEWRAEIAAPGDEEVIAVCNDVQQMAQEYVAEIRWSNKDRYHPFRRPYISEPETVDPAPDSSPDVT